jgi:membrane fusion protein (multidrug efflux system)
MNDTTIMSASNSQIISGAGTMNRQRQIKGEADQFALTLFSNRKSVALFAMLTILLITPVVAQDGMPPAAVVTAQVTSGTVAEEITLAGTTQPIRNSLVAAGVDGRVLERRVEKGDLVEKGGILFTLDRVRLERALDLAGAELQEVEARLQRAMRQEERALELYDKQVLSSSLTDEAISERSAQEGRKEQVKVRIESIKDDLERSMIRAPFAGVVTQLYTEVGQWLGQGEPIVRLADFKTIEITVDLPERYYSQVTRGAAATSTLASLPGLVLEGQVFAIVPQVESAARSFPVLVRAANPGQAVAAGMLAQVRLAIGASEQALLVPRDALVVNQTGEVVYKVEGDAATPIPVKSGRASGTLVEITGDGLQAGDKVVVRGNERLMPGQKIVEADPDAAAGVASATGGR